MKTTPLILLFLMVMAYPSMAFHIVCDSDSMAPTMDCYSKIIYARYYNTTPQIGDIIIYRLTNEDRFTYQFHHTYIIHRIINKTGSGYITQGDNNAVADPWIVKPYLIGWYVVGIK